ncbi:L10-interacting MYB domain-containing protein-like [Helianthus annuus]|uniref:L10-interacting MYB domain-containing protein-like n=1 Tax=Helianthus annuus TaxID=4232 RepID=UPI00165304D7|nr:L10-interacting MYB domain-containing protein-like [Helianthus annuus]
MDAYHTNVVDCETSTKKNKPKFLWNNDAFMDFVEACLLETRKGNKPCGHFNKIGWENIEKTMNEKTGKVIDRKQLKNKWDSMKKDWKLYDRLIRLETRISETRSLIEASDEWWEEKIKVNKDFAKFKDANLKIFESHYAPLFRDSVAVGDQTQTPLQFLNDNNPNDVRLEENMEGKGDSDEINIGDDEPVGTNTSCVY